MKTQTKLCTTSAEVKAETKNLDIARIVPIKIDDGGVTKDVENYVGIYNVSQGKFCAAVVPHYNLVQHKKYFDSFADALDRLNIDYTMKVSQTGNRAFADIEFNNKNIKFDKLNEEFTTGIRLANSYDKTTGVFVIPRYTRLACTNGMILTRSEKTLSIKHHSKLAEEIEGFIETRIARIINESSDLKVWVSACMKDSLEWMACCRIVEKLFPQMKHREEIVKRLGISVIDVEDKKTKKKTGVTYVWDKNEDKKSKFTRWEIYNAITNYITFGEHITPHIESIFQKKAEKLLLTPFAEMPKIEVKI